MRRRISDQTEKVRVCPESFMRPKRQYLLKYADGYGQRLVDATEVVIQPTGFVAFYTSRPYRRELVFAVPKKRVREIEMIQGEELVTPDCYEREVPRAY